jgi:hypothetical protein
MISDYKDEEIRASDVALLVTFFGRALLCVETSSWDLDFIQRFIKFIEKQIGSCRENLDDVFAPLMRFELIASQIISGLWSPPEDGLEQLLDDFDELERIKCIFTDYHRWTMCLVYKRLRELAPDHWIWRIDERCCQVMKERVEPEKVGEYIDVYYQHREVPLHQFEEGFMQYDGDGLQLDE